MELRQIQYFLAIVDFGTFMAAAKQVHVSQPTLSAGISKLEQSLDVKLFNRGSRSAVLTQAGELFLDDARAAYNQLLSAKSKLSIEQKKINLGILNTIPVDHVSEIIRAYRVTNPHVLIEVIVTNDKKLNDMLKKHKLDMAFTHNQQESANFIPLFKEELMVVVSTQHPFSLTREMELKQLNDQAFIERTKCEAWQELHNQFLKQNITPKTVCRAQSDDSVLSLVAAGLGISIMPYRNTPYNVHFIKIKDLQIIRNIGVTLSTNKQAQHVQLFYNSILNQFNIAE